MNQTANDNRLSKTHNLTMTVVIVALYVAMLTGEPALAQGGDKYELTWSTIDGGGGRSSGGDFVLTGTIGQPDADWSEGGDYEVLGGFWPGGPLCFVGFDDFARFAQMWLDMDLAGDLNGDNDLDFGDVGWFADYWLCYCPVPWPLK